MGVLKVLALLSVGTVCVLNEEASAVPTSFDDGQDMIDESAEEPVEGGDVDAASHNEGKQAAAPTAHEGSSPRVASSSAAPEDAEAEDAGDPSEAAVGGLAAAEAEEEEAQEVEDESTTSSDAPAEEVSLDGYATDDEGQVGDLLAGDATDDGAFEFTEEDELQTVDAAPAAEDEEELIADDEVAGLPEEDSPDYKEEEANEEDAEQYHANQTQVLSAAPVVVDEAPARTPKQVVRGVDESDAADVLTEVIAKFLSAASKVSFLFSLFVDALDRYQAGLGVVNRRRALASLSGNKGKNARSTSAAAPATAAAEAAVPAAQEDREEAGRAAGGEAAVAVAAAEEEEDDAVVAPEDEEGFMRPRAALLRSSEPLAGGEKAPAGQAPADLMLPASEEESEPAASNAVEAAPAEAAAPGDDTDPQQQADDGKAEKAAAPGASELPEAKRAGGVGGSKEKVASGPVKAASLNRQDSSGVSTASTSLAVVAICVSALSVLGAI